MNAFGPQASLADLTTILFKRKWSILTIFVAGIASAFVYVTLIRDDAYEITAKLLVKIGQEQAPPSTILTAPPAVLGYRNQDVNSEIDILTSSDLIAQVVDRLGLDRQAPKPPAPTALIPRIKYEVKERIDVVKDWTNELLISAGFRVRLNPREAAIFMLKQGLQVAAQPESNIIAVRLAVPARQGASAIVNTLLDLYLRFRLTLFQDRGAIPFFEEELASASAKLAGAESELQQLEANADIQALEKQKEILLEQIAEAETALQEATLGEVDARRKVIELDREALREDPEFAAIGGFDANTFPQAMLGQLADLQQEREKLRMTELDQGVRIQNNRAQFVKLLQMMTANVRAVAAERTAQRETRARELDELTARVKGLHERQMDWNSAKRRVASLEESFLFYRRKLEEATAAANLNEKHLGNVVIVERAIDPLTPVGMRKMVLMALALFMSTLFAIAWAVIAEFFDHRIYTAESLAAELGVPVLAVVPAAKRALRAQRREQPAMRATIGLGAGR
jgi:uncharacterized protein involved in exopolysaccharide biosynthesis